MGLSHFLLLLLYPRQIRNNIFRDRASARNKTSNTLTCNLLPISPVPLHSYNSQNLYPDGKKCAIAFLHSDSLSVPLTRDTRTYLFYRKLV